MVDPSGLSQTGIPGPSPSHDGVINGRPRKTGERKAKLPQRRSGLSNLYDVSAAVRRLLELLAHDLEHGIPENVPLRGYYLNILV